MGSKRGHFSRGYLEFTRMYAPGALYGTGFLSVLYPAVLSPGPKSVCIVGAQSECV